MNNQLSLKYILGKNEILPYDKYGTDADIEFEKNGICTVYNKKKIIIAKHRYISKITDYGYPFILIKTHNLLNQLSN